VKQTNHFGSIYLPEMFITVDVLRTRF